MSDSKIGIFISNMIRKTDRIEFYIGSSFAILSIVGITSIYIHYLQFSKIKQLECKLNDIELLHKNNTQYVDLFKSDTMIQFKNDLLHITDIHQKLVEKISQLTSLQNKDTISTSTSMTTFTPNTTIDNSDPPMLYDPTINCDEEDNELLNECYDAIPLNNVKKNTKLNWLYF